MLYTEIRTMIRIALVLSFIMFVYGAPNPIESDAEIKDYQYKNDGSGNYFFRFVTSNGITRQESGHLVNAGQSDEYTVVEGMYSYTDTDGHLKLINYKADQNGYSIRPIQYVPYSDTGPLIASLLGK